MQLDTFWRSSASYRVRIGLHLKGIAFESLPRGLRSGAHRTFEYLDANPQGLVPALRVGSAVLAQSLAILEYLDESCSDPPLLPDTPLARAQVRGMALSIACDVHPLNNLRVLAYLRDVLGHVDAQVNAWVAHWIRAGFTGLEVEANRYSGDGRHLFGDRVTLADLCLVPQVYNARRFGVGLEPFPALAGIAAHLDTLPAFIAARPENQPDAE